MSALTLPACLITQPVQFEPPSGSPSSITTPMMDAPFPLDEIVRLTTADTMIEPFVVEVRDPDVDEVLEYRVFIDRQPDRISDVSGTIPVIDRAAGVSRTTRRLEFPLQGVRSRLLSNPAGGCHRIELFVSGRFQSELPLPAREGDLATAVWWVATEPAGGGDVEMTLCP
jgi:hypothetical protein